MSNYKELILEASIKGKNKDVIVNPDTKNRILVSSALKYPKDSKVYKLAVAFMNRKGQKLPDEKGTTSKEEKPDYGDLSVSQSPSGGIVVSAMRDGQRVMKKYFDYTEEEAVASFKEEHPEEHPDEDMRNGGDSTEINKEKFKS